MENKPAVKLIIFLQVWCDMNMRQYRPRNSSEKPFKCPVPNCDKNFYYNHHLKRHVERQHSEFSANSGYATTSQTVPQGNTEESPVDVNARTAYSSSEG